MKKRILHVIANLSIGGAEKVARDIGMYVSPEEYEFHYIVFGDEVGPYEMQLLSCGHKVFHLPSPSQNYSAFYRSLCRLMQKYHYTAVHGHTMFNIGWIMLAAKRSGVPIRIAHAHSAMSDGRSLKETVYEAAMRFLILRCATALVSCGEAAGNRLYGEKAFARRGILILNGVDVDAFSYNEQARSRIRRELSLDQAFVIGHAGHLREVKNQKYLIDLLPKILQRKSNAMLLFLGDGEDLPMLKQRAEANGVSDRVVFTGNVLNVPDYLSAMDVFAFPSLFEGMPLSIIEVQANGLPCVLSTGVPADVHLTDLIHSVSLEQPDQWVDSISTLERRDTHPYAVLLKEKGFDTNSVMSRFIQLYEQSI